MIRQPVILLFLLTVLDLAAQPISFPADPQNLGVGVNTSYGEVSPVITPDGMGIYINRKDHPDNLGGPDNDDIWFAQWNDTAWTSATNMGAPLNNSSHNFVSSVTPDGNQLLLANIYRENGLGGPGVSISSRTKDGWSWPRAQVIEGYDNRSRFAEFYMANNAQVLLMAIEMEGTLGKRDLYVSFKKNGNNWERPLNLGPVVNTLESDVAPFLASDGVTLYYSTKGHKTLGGMDIFMTRRLDDSWTNWSEPVNIGPAVNTPGFDAYFTIPASGKYGYFASSHNAIGGTDIFRIELPNELRPKPVVLVKGRVSTEEGKPLAGRVIYEELPSGKQVGTALADPVSGHFSVVLPFGKNYSLRAETPGYYGENRNLDLTSTSHYKELDVDLFLVPLEVGKVIRLNNLFFESGKAELQYSSIPELDRLIRMLERTPTLVIQIAGHTDNRGSNDDNLVLSQDRVQAVIEYLISKKIRNERLQSVAYGEARPKATNDTPAGRALNRRVEFVVISK